MMWSFFSRDVVKDFAYEITSEVEKVSFWKLHDGRKKSTGEIVSIFVYEVSSVDNPTLYETAKMAVKRLKTLRHPSILTYIDSLEADKFIYLVTEHVVSLETHLMKKYTKDQEKLSIAWGIHLIAQGLIFLNKDCCLFHHNVCMPSIFVDRAGEWKLAGVEYITPSSGPRPRKVTAEAQKYDPPECNNQLRNEDTWSHDSWGLGCLIWEAFNGPLVKTSSLKSTEKIPPPLRPRYSELICNDPSLRPSISEFLQKTGQGDYFKKGDLVETMLFLKEIHIQDKAEKVVFFNGLTKVLETFPPDICQYKILPELINAFEFGNAGSSVLNPMFIIGKMLSEEEYQMSIVPCVVKLFSSKSRSTRAKLLLKMEEFIPHVQPAVINNQIFPNVIQGFLDTSAAIRDHTIKCMLFLAPKLNYGNLNEEMLKHFAKLQTKDEQGGIRTNATVCLGKIASYLHPQTRKKILIPAFLRAMRDPFPPARTAAILALAATENYFNVRECATKVLPALCHLTIDQEKTVRDQAFKSVYGFLRKLEKVSENPELANEIEKATRIFSPSETAISWTSWAVSSLADKFYKSAKSSVDKPSAPTSLEPCGSEPLNVRSIDEIKTPLSFENVVKESSNIDLNDDNWNLEDWKDLEDDSTCQSASMKLKFTVNEKDVSQHGEWDVDNWESFENEDATENLPESRHISSYFTSSNLQCDPFSQECGSADSSSGDGWVLDKHVWENCEKKKPDTVCSTIVNSQITEEKRRSRDEKRKQISERKQRERQTSKPIKLGAQKLA